MQQPKSGEYMTKIFCIHNLSVLFLTKLFFFQLVLPEYLLHLLINLLFLLSGEWFSLLINVPLIIYHIHRLETFLCHCMHTEISTYSLLGQCNFYPRAFSIPAVKTLSSKLIFTTFVLEQNSDVCWWIENQIVLTLRCSQISHPPSDVRARPLWSHEHHELWRVDRLSERGLDQVGFLLVVILLVSLWVSFLFLSHVLWGSWVYYQN